MNGTLLHKRVLTVSDLYEISFKTTGTLKRCPVILSDESTCGTELQVMTTYTIIGDDYGAWPEVGVFFDCGHTFAQMEMSIKMSEYI